ncbi:MAG: phosphoglycerate dehydrogenase [Candidatus Gastranaerophilaceae bacterium]|jgi:D-3-phosphoglycerate dehydrogenase
MYKVLIVDNVNEVAGDILKSVASIDYTNPLSEDELVNVIENYDALMVRSQTKVTKKALEKGKKLKIVGRAGVGVDNIDVEEATKAGVIVVNSPDGNTTAAAEQTVALMLSMARHIPDANMSTRQGKWERSKLTGTEVFNKNLGIIGLGKIGLRVAKAAIGLGMKVFVYDPFASKENVEMAGATYIKNLNDFWPICDYITVHVPKTKDTLNLINAETISKMKDGVRLINCSRGGIINEADLKEAIDSKKVAQAAVDVYTTEPISQDNPLLACKGDIILTPHLGASTEEAQLNVAIDVAEQIKEVLEGGSARSAVNIPALKAEKLEPVKDYMNLAENIGLLISQLTVSAIKRIEIITHGTLAQLDTSPLKIAILKGILSQSMESVNYVNAPVIANSRGIEIIESKSEYSYSYVGLITVKVHTSTEDHTVCGALIADNTPRIVKIDDYNTSLTPAEHIIIAPHHDRPGMIAKVAAILGEKSVNISMMQVARKYQTAGGESIMIINTDNPVNDDLLDKIKEIDGVYGASYVTLRPERTTTAEIPEHIKV